MRVFFDTNVLLDIALGREPFVQESLRAFEQQRATGETPLIAPHSLATFYYMVAKSYDSDRARIAAEDLLTTAEVARFDHDSALRCNELEMADFEDAMIVSAAMECEADCILTRNELDFRNSPIPVLCPEAFHV